MPSILLFSFILYALALGDEPAKLLQRAERTGAAGGGRRTGRATGSGAAGGSAEAGDRKLFHMLGPEPARAG
jgi:hypothetical protein